LHNPPKRGANNVLGDKASCRVSDEFADPEPTCTAPAPTQDESDPPIGLIAGVAAGGGLNLLQQSSN